MGVFDTFVTKVKCPECGKIVKDFQSKDGLNLLETFRIGKKANYYRLRERTFKEKEQDLKNLKKDYPKIYESKWKDWVGWLRKSGRVLSILGDGQYEVHTSCEYCKSWLTGLAVIKDGIFKEVIELKVEE